MFDQFYGLSARPFQLTPDPAFYFESATHRKALSYLGYGMAQAEGFIVITGEVGSGKSTLVAHLMKKIDIDQMTVGQVVTSNLDGDELVHVAAQSFGLNVEGHDKASALGAIENFLHEEARDGRRCMLVVDESQNLSVEALEELRMLSNFQLGSHPLLQLLLLGQPEFKQVLASHDQLEQLRQRVIAAHHLEAMMPNELEPYVRHRLECVGWSGNPQFDGDVFEGIYEATGGIPRKVNQLLTRLLLLGAVEQRTRIDTAMLTTVLTEMLKDTTPVDTPAVSAALPMDGPVKHVMRAASADPIAEAATQPAPDNALIEAMLAERDLHIAALQDTVAGLSKALERLEADDGDSAIEDRMSAIEANAGSVSDAIESRVSEQERLMRHVLTMLIEWMENGSASRAAA